MLYLQLVILTIVSASSASSLSWKYHNNTELENFLKDFATEAKCDPAIRRRLYSIGRTRNGDDLWVVEITASKKERLGVPNIKLIGTVHGNEPVGREILLHFMEHLRVNYKVDSAITWLLDNTKIHFLPNLNPRGFALSYENMCDGEHVRNNGRKGKDLNRNFPDFYHLNRIPEEPETKAVKQWLNDVPFILSAALHGGALVANYPFDTVKEDTSLERNQSSLTPDNDVFEHLARVYAKNHLTMHKGDSCNSSKFEGGITNGAAWYSIIGGMQDYNYAFHGCMEVTLEISCCKYPPARKLQQLWQENKKALINYCFEALKGVTGRIIDATTLKPIPRASLRISGRNMTFFTSKTGEFWRLLLSGSYKLEISAEGYYEKVFPFVVQNDNGSMPQLTFLNISLLNSSVSTTSTSTEQGTTETTTKFLDDTLDGASTTDFSINAESTEDAPVARSLTRTNQGTTSMYNTLQIYSLLLFFLIV